MEKVSNKQLQNIVKWSGGSEASIPEAQKKAIFAYLRKQGLTGKRDIVSLFGRFYRGNEEAVTKYVSRKSIEPKKLFIAIKRHARSINELSEETKLPKNKVKELVNALMSFSLIRKHTRKQILFGYLDSTKFYSIGKFKHKLTPYVSKEIFKKKPLTDEWMYVWSANSMTYNHAMKLTGKELYLFYANSAAKKFADTHPDSKCLLEMVKELFGLTVREIDFIRTPTGDYEHMFEEEFRFFITKLIKKIDPTLTCTDEEHIESEKVIPDMLVTKGRKKIAIELKKASKGYLVDCSIKQFLRYVDTYDYTGIVCYHQIPRVANELGSKVWSGKEFMNFLDKYYESQKNRYREEKKPYDRAPADDNEFCKKVYLTNVYLAYRLCARQIEKFNFNKLKIRTIVGEEAFDIFRPEFKKGADKVLFFTSVENYEQLAKKLKLTKELAEMRKRTKIKEKRSKESY